MSTERLAKFIVETSYKALPGEGIKTAKEAIVDCLGCALVGYADKGSKILIEYARERGGNPEAGIIGGGFKAPASEAAWVNGTLAHALDYDDVAPITAGHPSVALLPAALALVEKHHLSGKEVLLAYIIGYEVMAAIGKACALRHYLLGWHCTSTFGSLGAAAVGAKLLKLNLEETRMTLGIAASLTGGLKQNFGTMTKPLHAGNAARNGVVAADMAQRGFTAVQDIMETPMGFCKVFGGGEELDIAGATQDLGESFQISSTLEIKPYPSCRGTHPSIDAALGLRKKNRFEIDDIAEVECHGSAWIPQSACIYSHPKTGLEGKFSVEYCVLRALMENGVSMKHFTDEKVMEHTIQELIPKVKYIPDPEAMLFTPFEVVVKLKNGRVLSHKVTSLTGDPSNPVSQDDLHAKYRDCAAAVLSPQEIERSLEMASNLEKLKDITPLMNIITKIEAGR
ncbi:MAG: MmgE/PrpD family protein [Dehalococcoidia bacterium]|nr:MmgE/PrpD family protein [Dehalococcoidia bacterium]